MKLKNWYEVLIEDWPAIAEVTNRTIRTSQKLAREGYRTSMRIATGRVYTDKDYEARRARILTTSLP
jgi:hypothetical protein